MKLTAIQAAERLGVTNGTVTKWGDAGLLKRTPTGNGTKKRHFLYDAASVSEFKKTRGKQRLGRNAVAAAIENGKQPESDKVIIKVRRPFVTPSGPSSFMEKLDRIEKMVEQLLRMWS